MGKTDRHCATGFDIAPFALPGTGSAQIRFEEARDIERVVVDFDGASPSQLGLSYWQKVWPQDRCELRSDTANPCRFGWIPMDDAFNGRWQRAAVRIRRLARGHTEITFRGLTAELSHIEAYDVTFRRTLGLRLDCPDGREPTCVRVYTGSVATRSVLRVCLDAGRRTPGENLGLDGYNLRVRRVQAPRGVRVKDGEVRLGRGSRRSLILGVEHMTPTHRYSGDDGHLTLSLGRDRFTISLESLRESGPIWYAEKGVYITLAEDETSFEAYRQAHGDARGIAARVRQAPEQTLAGAMHGQPRAHPVYYPLGVKHQRQGFLVEPNGDLLFLDRNIREVPGPDTARYRGTGAMRFSFGLWQWYATAWSADAAPMLGCTARARLGPIAVEEKVFAAPLEASVLDQQPRGNDTVVAMLRFRFRNEGETDTEARLPIRLFQDSRKSQNAYGGGQDEHLLPHHGEADELTVVGNRITGSWEGQETYRCAFVGNMEPLGGGREVVLRRRLAPGETCETVLKIPFISPEGPDQEQALETMDFESCHGRMRAFWQREAESGSSIRVPEPHIQELYAAHLAHVQVTDFAIPDGSGLLQTSVGTGTYGNYCNESCMIIQELDQRGLHDDAQRRLDTWVRYQGTVPLPGNFTDCDGVFYGCNGFEGGTYNQHHGWVLWCLCEHFFLTDDGDWFASVAGAVVRGADWVFRQRQATRGELPHSRGWESGCLPAGSLEDVTDFYYWLSTNALTWRGTDAAARALEKTSHPQAARVRRESDAYRRDLVRCFETMRQVSPLVRLRDGRWVPHYPSRLYNRGRDLGWIREVLEGSVYLMISGLYPSTGRKAKWILDDFQDNRYPQPPYGYAIQDFKENWYDRAGFSIQPNLLAGLLPYLDRDEIEVYLWMYFNALAACYREEIGAIVEHPYPVLGYSNRAHFKTSDQANSIMWLRYMFTYWTHDALYLGRAIPRQWLCHGNDIGIDRVCTYFGQVDVRYRSESDQGRILLTANLEMRDRPPRILARFRHPTGARLQSVCVDGRAWTAFDPVRGDVDITDLSGRVEIEARY